MEIRKIEEKDLKELSTFMKEVNLENSVILETKIQLLGNTM